MRYKNTKTGAIIDSPCIISGGDWVKYTEQEVINTTEEVNEEVNKTEEVKEVEKIEEVEEGPEKEEEGFDGITIKQIKQELDAFGIKYNPRAKKQELYDLMVKGM